MQDKGYFTTGEVARIIGISQKTVKNYCDHGKIKSLTNCITKYRRIPRKNLVEFLKKNRISLQILEKPLEKNA